MKMRKFFLVILTIIPFGMFAQEIKYVTVPASSDQNSAPGYYQTPSQSQSQTTQQFSAYPNALFRDTLKTSQKKAINTTFFKNKPQDNWFFSLYGGAAMLQSEESRYRKFTDQINFPTGGFAIGKWWTPVWGLRLSATAAKLTGFARNANANPDTGDPDIVGQPFYFQGSWYTGKNYTSGQGYDPDNGNYGLDGIQNNYTPGTTPDGANLIYDRYLNHDGLIKTNKGWGYTYGITYAAASLDLMLNLKNYFTRYNPKAFFNPVLYAGVGMAHTFAEKSKERTAVNSIMGKAGMQLNFRLGSGVDLFVDAQSLILPEFFDRRVGDGNTMDLVFNGMIGFTYKFKERYFYEPVAHTQISYVPSPAPAVAPATPYRDDIADRLKAIEDKLDKLDKLDRVPPGAGNSLMENLRIVVYFVIDRWEVRQSEMYKLDEIARFMNKYPRVRVTIQGYADVQTAYPAYNMKLSDRRAHEVARILGSKYGIDTSRLRIEKFGDTVQPFEINNLNRAVIAFDIPEN